MASLVSHEELDEFNHGDAKPLPQKYANLAKELFGETREKREKLIPELRSKMLEENLPMDDDDALILRFLRAADFSVDKALSNMKTCLTQRKVKEEVFGEMDFTKSMRTALLEEKMLTALAHRDKYGRRVFISFPGRWKPEKIHLVEVSRLSALVVDLASIEEKSQIAGVSCICDAKDLGTEQLSYCDPHFIADLLSVPDRHPIRRNACMTHLINMPSAAKVLMEASLSLVDEDVRQRVIIHSSPEELFKYFSPEILPQEIGGNLGPIDNAKLVEILEGLPEEFDAGFHIFDEDDEEDE